MDSFPLSGTLESIATPLVGLVFFVVVAGFIILSFVLDHHWRQYSTNAAKVKRMRFVYIGVSGFLIVIMLLTLPFIFS